MNKQDRVIKFAVVGSGNIGKRHIAVLDAEPGAKISAFCDTDRATRNEVSNLYDISAFEDFSEMLASTDADVISICTPHALHAPMTVEACAAGKHVIVEKPIGLSSADADAMVAAAKKHDVALIVVKQNRYNKPIVLTSEALNSGKLGQVFMVKCDVLWNRHDEYYADSPWRGRKATEGGALFTQASHFIDLLIWWFGDVIHASSWIENKNHEIEIEDCGAAILRFSSGVIGSVNWTTCVYRENYEGSITIISEFGTVKIGGKYLNTIEYWDVKDNPLPEGIEFTDKPNQYGKYQGTSSNHDKMFSDVIHRFRGGKNHSLVDGAEARKTVRAIEMIYESAQRNPWQG